LAGQVAEVDVPLSPLHATHEKEVASQSGVPLPQFEVLLAKHSRQRPVPPPAASSQRPLRHVPLVPAAVAWTQAPSPFRRPHTLSAPQAPLEQRTEAPFEHVPPPGMGDPVLAFAVHTFVPVLHHSEELQSPSTLQPTAGLQVPLVEHAPERHTVIASI